MLTALCVRDDKSDSFGHPFFVPTIAIGIRMFGEWCQDKNGVMGRHPADFRLFKVGTFDDETATFTNEATPSLVSSGSDFSSPAPSMHLA